VTDRLLGDRPATPAGTRASDLPYARPYWDGSEAAALTAALETGMWTNGEQVRVFEQELSALCGAPTVTMSSGTTAVLALLSVVGRRITGPKLLISPTLNFAAGPASALMLGWDVALCDVRPDDLTMCPDSLADVLERVHARYEKAVVLPVHYAGHSCDMVALSAVCRRYDADLIEDACHAIGGHYTGTDLPIGSWPESLAAYFSFHPTKPVAAGEGGAVATQAAGLADELRLLRNHEMAPVEFGDDLAPWPYTIGSPGMNLRLSEFNAAVGVVQARRAEESRRERARLAARYHQALSELTTVRAVPGTQRAGSAHHLFPVVFDTRALRLSKRALLGAFFAEGIRCQVHYTPLHRLPAFDDAVDSERSGPFPTADEVWPGLVSLPLWRGMTDPDQERVIDVVQRIARGMGEA
jgi:dTDP-4-amino-4,6-dideoxygalactose transaminase